MEVTDHPRQSGIVGRKLTHVAIAWAEGPTACITVPDAIQFCSRERSVWIPAGRPAAWLPGEVYQLGTDDVMVVFIAECAAKVGHGAAVIKKTPGLMAPRSFGSSYAVGRGGVEPPTFRFSGGRSYRLSYLPATAP